jgi:bifunctional DNA-binding transcriptional regulator/antitoxin component of YhaV-PrlF toxin-antitoxin module
MHNERNVSATIRIVKIIISMTVVVKNREPLVVPTAARRRAGFKSGQELEVKASGGVITIVPKVSPDELQDEREVRDPKIRAAIRDGHQEFLAGKSRPIEDFFAARGPGALFRLAASVALRER